LKLIINKIVTQKSKIQNYQLCNFSYFR